jgi:hypothetical protein
MSYIDTRDLLKRKEELEELRDALEAAREERKDLGDCPATTAEELEVADEAVEDAEAEFGEDEQKELAEIEEIETEVRDFRYGETLIPESEFVNYAIQFAEDIGAVPRDLSWPACHIDWSAAADSLRADYTEIEYQGETYLVRA